jgi:hypothetical protein
LIFYNLGSFLFFTDPCVNRTNPMSSFYPFAAPFQADCSTCGDSGALSQDKVVSSSVKGSQTRSGNPAVPPMWEDCPPRMSDGRLFTDYRPRCVVNLEHAKPMMGSQEYRIFLIGNGKSLIDSRRSEAASRAACVPCKSPYEQGTMAPEVDRVVCNKTSCARVAVKSDPSSGQSPIGTGIQYNTFFN